MILVYITEKTSGGFGKPPVCTHVFIPTIILWNVNLRDWIGQRRWWKIESNFTECKYFSWETHRFQTFNGLPDSSPYLHLKVAKSLCCASVRTQGAAEDSRLNIIHHNCCRLFFTHKPVSVIKSWCGRGKTVWSAHQTVLHTEKKKPQGERDRERARGLFLSQEKHTPDHNYVFEASLWPLPPHPEPGAQCFQCVTRQSSMQLLHTHTHTHHIPVSNHSYTQIYTFIHTHTF